MPSSLEGDHCEICSFEDVGPTDDQIVAAREDVSVSTYLFDSVPLREPHGASPIAEEHALPESRDGAARACADYICRGTCLLYVYTRDPAKLTHELSPRYPDSV